ncbi:MAG: GNAT family N-acetyltransferase [bacterium]|nr:GNAT family N-acetyltransferase [bacterium]
MIFRRARMSELDEIAHLQQLVFRPDQPASVARYLAYTNEDPFYTLDHSRVIEVDGRIAAHLRIWDRTVMVRGVPLLAAGIGSLYVHPSYRGRGYARALMRDSERYFLDAGYDFGLLFTIIGTPFYEAMDWIPISLPAFRFSSMDVTRTGLDIQALDISRDLDEVRALYTRCGMSHTGAVLRDKAYWTSGPARFRSSFPQWGVSRDNQLVAYVSLDLDENEIWVKEICVSPEDSLALVDLASKVLGLCRGILTGSLPKGHPFVHVLETISFTRAVWETHDEMMVKGVNWARMREKLGLDGIPDHGPESEAAFWPSLLGPDVFYWWTDIF